MEEVGEGEADLWGRRGEVTGETGNAEGMMQIKYNSHF